MQQGNLLPFNCIQIHIYMLISVLKSEFHNSCILEEQGVGLEPYGSSSDSVTSSDSLNEVGIFT